MDWVSVQAPMLLLVGWCPTNKTVFYTVVLCLGKVVDVFWRDPCQRAILIATPANPLNHHHRCRLEFPHFPAQVLIWLIFMRCQNEIRKSDNAEEESVRIIITLLIRVQKTWRRRRRRGGNLRTTTEGNDNDALLLYFGPTTIHSYSCARNKEGYY